MDNIKQTVQEWCDKHPNQATYNILYQSDKSDIINLSGTPQGKYQATIRFRVDNFSYDYIGYAATEDESLYNAWQNCRIMQQT